VYCIAANLIYVLVFNALTYFPQLLIYVPMF
jgi:hypothetical protein